MNETWKELVDAAVAFKAQAPWRWMEDSDVFGVRDPASGEVGYCCVLGNLGQVLALCVYRGSEGLESYKGIAEGRIGPDEAMFNQFCLMASFEDREELEPRDREVLKATGGKFRGAQAWPMFRTYQPGYAPWRLTDEEARYLGLALRQSVPIAERFKADRKLFRAPKRGLYLVRTPEETAEGLVWRDEWQAPAPLAKREAPAPPPLDRERVTALRQRLQKTDAVWEFDCPMAPMEIGEGERPWYPRIGLWVDHASAFVLGTQIASPAEYRQKFQDEVLRIMEKTGQQPRRIDVKSTEALAVLAPLAGELDMPIKRVGRLPALEAALDALYKYMGGGTDEM